MGLSVREQQALRSIEGGLTVSAPFLASRLAIFTRLTAGEAFPARESIQACWFSGAGRWPPVWPVLWLVISVTLIVVGLAVGHDGGQGPCHPLTLSCGWHAGRSAPW
jgi:hypothetical protein